MTLALMLALSLRLVALRRAEATLHAAELRQPNEKTHAPPPRRCPSSRIVWAGPSGHVIKHRHLLRPDELECLAGMTRRGEDRAAIAAQYLQPRSKIGCVPFDGRFHQAAVAHRKRGAVPDSHVPRPLARSRQAAPRTCRCDAAQTIAVRKACGLASSRRACAAMFGPATAEELRLGRQEERPSPASGSTALRTIACCWERPRLSAL
jgi:hypothetical protein